jgi:hypothetical protein
MSHACPRLVKLEHLHNNGMDNINLFKELFQWKKIVFKAQHKTFSPQGPLIYNWQLVLSHV